MLALLAGALFAAQGCRTSTVIDEYRGAETIVSSGESLVVLGRRHEMDRGTERDFVECVGQKLNTSSTEFDVIPESEFVDALYPWFETSTAPMDVAKLDDLFANRVVSAKLDALNLRYFVWINGFTETTDTSGSMSCTVGPGGGGCFGFKSWDDEANYEAAVWDLKDRSLAAKVSTETEGTSYVPAVIVPIPLLARVKATACDAMGNQLLDLIGAET